MWNRLTLWLWACYKPNTSQLSVSSQWQRCNQKTSHWRQCYRSCTGFQFDVGWMSRWPPWSTCHCLAWLQPIWPPTVSWSPMKVVVSCLLPHQGRVSWGKPTATMETGVLQLQVRSCKTFNLPAELRQADISFQRFKWLLKTFLFGCWDRGALWLTVKAAPHKFSHLLTYLAVTQMWLWP